MTAKRGFVFASLLLSIALVAGGCTSGKNGESSPASSGSPVSSVSSGSAESSGSSGPSGSSDALAFPLADGAKLRITSVEVGPSQDFLAEGGLPVLNDMEKATGVKIDWDLIPLADFDTVASTRLAAGNNLPDIVRIAGDPVAYANSGVIIPLNDLIDENAPNLKAWLEKEPGIKQMLTFPDGKMYLLPSFISEGAGEVSDGYSGYTLLLRTDWLKKLGLEAPNTRDDLYNVLKAFKTRDPNGNGQADEIPLSGTPWGWMSVGAAVGWTYDLHLGASSGWHADDSGKVEYEYASPKLKGWLTTMSQWHAEGLIDPEFANLSSEVFNSQLTNSVTGAMAFQLSWPQLTVNPQIQQQTGDPEAGLFPILPLIGEGGKRMTEALTAPTYQAVGGGHFAISKDAKNPALALKWWDYTNYSEQAALWNEFGVEGLSYTMVDGNPVITDEFLNDERGFVAALSAIGSYHWPMSQLTTKRGMATLYESTKQWHPLGEEISANYRDVYFVAGVPTKEESDRMAALMTDIDTYVKEMVVKFIKGQEPMDRFDAYLQQLDKMGIQEVIQIKQAQYDRVH